MSGGPALDPLKPLLLGSDHKRLDTIRVDVRVPNQMRGHSSSSRPCTNVAKDSVTWGR
jgi:hypothetical protein